MSALTAILLIAMNGLNAQNFRGNQYLNNQRGACVNSTGMTVEQQAQVLKVSAAHQAEMDALRVSLRSSTTLSERNAVRAKMDQSLLSHRAQIIELGATPVNTPHAGFIGRGRGAGRGVGLRAARSTGYGRGLGPCGGGLGRRR